MNDVMTTGAKHVNSLPLMMVDDDAAVYWTDALLLDGLTILVLL